MLLALQLNNLLEEAPTLVEVPDVVGESQATGTTTLETALFVVAVQEEYSSLAAGLVSNQSPAGGGFAAEGSTVTIYISLGVRPASDGGSAKRKQRRRSHLVEIDGQFFEVANQQEAIELLQKATNLAQTVAKQQTERVAKRIKRGKPTTVQAPVIKTSSPEIMAVVDDYRERIESIYRQIAIDSQIRELMRVRQLQEQDDEDAIAVLLH